MRIVVPAEQYVTSRFFGDSTICCRPRPSASGFLFGLGEDCLSGSSLEISSRKDASLPMYWLASAAVAFRNSWLKPASINSRFSLTRKFRRNQRADICGGGNGEIGGVECRSAEHVPTHCPRRFSGTLRRYGAGADMPVTAFDEIGRDLPPKKLSARRWRAPQGTARKPVSIDTDDGRPAGNGTYIRIADLLVIIPAALPPWNP